MALSKLVILVEQPGENFQFNENDDTHRIPAMFNPTSVSMTRQVEWKSQEAAKRDSPELQYTTSQPATLSIELFFDTYDSAILPKPSVLEHTSKLLALTSVAGNKHRPPICRIQWGYQAIIFQGVLQGLDQQYTMFTEDGTPVRATVKCTFTQWRSNDSDLKKQNLMSSDVVKTLVVRRGQTLTSIAADEYGDPNCWRQIAEENQIDDPLSLEPGTTLLLPALRQSPKRLPDERTQWL
ncbi:MAG TPA: LysM peptidoglycan-binding domain-containing protein [Paraburkholderia sp.]|jgi:nucleoid-associated protein YgaU|nr:LysM peptidoglycan-binding domain-containing protein [Paraburkholderia sp.]